MSRRFQVRSRNHLRQLLGHGLEFVLKQPALFTVPNGFQNGFPSIEFKYLHELENGLVISEILQVKPVDVRPAENSPGFQQLPNAVLHELRTLLLLIRSN